MFSLKQGLKALIDRQLTRLYRRLAEIQAKDAQVATTSLLGTLRSCGAGIVVVNPIKMYGGDKISIGNNVHIGENAFIRGEGGLSIGDNTFISRNLVLYTMSHRYNGDRLPYDDGFLIKPVIVGSNVWIGMNVCIAPGTTIGDGAIIGLGTTVSGNVPPLSIVGSQKWRIIGQRDAQQYNQLNTAAAFADPWGRPLMHDCERHLR